MIRLLSAFIADLQSPKPTLTALVAKRQVYNTLLLE